MSQFSDNAKEELAAIQALRSLGQRLAAHRVRRNITQQKLAREAGVSRSTLARLEGGDSVQLAAMVRILRALDLLERLSELIPATEISPLQVLDNDGKVRRRASSPRREKKVEREEWTWGEDQGDES